MAPGRKGRIIKRTIVITVVAVLSLGMEVSGWLARGARRSRPRCRGRPCTRSCRSCSSRAPVWRGASARARVPSRLMVAFAVLWIPLTFFRVVENIGWLWPLLYGVAPVVGG